MGRPLYRYCRFAVGSADVVAPSSLPRTSVSPLNDGRRRPCGRLLVVAVLAVACHYDAFSIPATVPTYSLHTLGVLSGGATSQAFSGTATVIVGAATDAGGAPRAVTFAGGAAARLPEPTGTTTSMALGVNASGVVVGCATMNDTQVAVVWPSATTPPLVLPGLGGVYETARAINDEGTVFGTAQTDTGDTVLVLWQPTGAGEYMAARVDSTSGVDYTPAGINMRGQLAGTTADGNTGFVWDSGSGFETVNAPNNGGTVVVHGLNNYGVVTGAFTTAGGPTGAFLYTGVAGSLELGDPPNPYTNVVGSAVTDGGILVGYASSPNASGADSIAVVVVGSIIDTADTWTVLPTMGGRIAEPSTNGVTLCGVVLGYATPPGTTTRLAAAWVPAGCTIP